ncbi:MAG: prenyltransferase/squalene oxidase repeat-containing protein [Desulfobacterales bacterium]|jgi:squalene-hopene/tetraprenyl-beta-curcumene cyclase|nr:prenyltransferase/squalene oxidase repeat-containing protein [Desulfobacterales bacterium]
MLKKMLVFILIAGIFSITTTCLGAEEQPIRLITSFNSSSHLSLLNESKHTLEQAHEFLLKSQLPNGSWNDNPAITALVLYSFLLQPIYNPGEKSEPAIANGFKYLESFVKPDGAIYKEEYRNYMTAVCLLAFAESKMEKYATIIDNAKKFLIKFQLDEDEGVAKDHPFYGGIGYGGDDRPDLSNTQFALDAIKAAEDYEARYTKLAPQNKDQMEKDEAELGLHWKKALVFLARCQNVKSVNDMPYAVDDGGFIYETGTYKKERSHSYGSMTYAGVKSLLYAKVDKNDIRVKSAVSWIQNNYTLDENPGFGQDALYYYYMTFAKCLDALGEDVIEDSKGVKHPWREELIKKLISMQHEEGYWVHTHARYLHNVKDLVTAYAIISIKYSLNNMIEKKV